MLRQVDEEKLFNPFTDEQLTAENYFKTSQKKTLRNVDFWLDSDDKFIAELENAVKQYKKNIKINEPVGMEPNLGNEQGECENENIQSLNIFDNMNSDPEREKIKENINREINSNDKVSTDLQDLINYFFLHNKNKIKKSPNKNYVDYEKQGAIPKIRTARDKSSERNRGKNQLEIKNAQDNLKSKKTRIKKIQQKVPELFLNYDRPGIKENLVEYTFIEKSNTDDVIVKISEESCSKPFFYIVPENPSPNFFLSRGSYYIIPKTPSSASKNKIFFHPENKAGCELGDGALNPKINFSRLISNKELDVEHHSRTRTNNLGKEVLQKIDSHLNIGPVDSKLSDSNNNLETNYDSNKIFNKNLLNFNNPNASSGFQEGSREKPLEKTEMHSDSLIKTEPENSNSVEAITSDAEVFELPQLNEALQTLLSEFPHLDADSAKILANNYQFDEEGLNNYITSTRIERIIEHQLEKMPENSLDELREKYNEFQDELVDNYIQEIQRANKIRQQFLNMQLVLPDADPDFLLQEIEKLNGDDNAFNILTDQLLDNKNYPKIPENSLSGERRKWWQEYVEKFDIKNYVLKVPNPGDFAGAAGDNNNADQELILKFLQSRYPSQTRDFLIQTYESSNKNISSTCDSLNDVQLIRLSESSFRNEAFTESLLKELCYIDHRKEIDEYLREIKELKEMETEEARLNNCFLFCPLCSDDELITSEAICCSEGHVFCKDCIKRYIFMKMGDGVFRFACPLEFCNTFLSITTLQEILPENILSNILNKQQAEEISTAEVDGLEFCRYCEFAYIPNPEDNIFKCLNPVCLSETCRKCHEKNHIPLRCEEIERPVDVEARKKIEESMTQELVRICPTCQKKFVKIDGCNKMVCVCGTVICYICRKKVTGYDHFSSFNSLPRSGRCPLVSNNTVLHVEEVFRAGIRTRNEILQDNQNIRILHDPTVSQNDK